MVKIGFRLKVRMLVCLFSDDFEGYNGREKGEFIYEFNRLLSHLSPKQPHEDRIEIGIQKFD